MRPLSKHDLALLGEICIQVACIGLCGALVYLAYRHVHWSLAIILLLGWLGVVLKAASSRAT